MERNLTRFRRSALYVTLALLLGISGLRDLRAQSQGATPWKPSKNVEMVVAANIGGGLDRTSRVTQKLLQDLGLVPTSMAVINKPGGGGNIGWTYLAQFPGDAHYVSIASPTLLTNHIAGRSRLSHGDFTRIALLFSEYIAFVTGAESAIQNGGGLVRRLKENTGSVTFAVSPAFGGANHIAVGFLAKAAGIDLKRVKVVNFNSAGEAMSMLLGGHIDVNVAVASNAAGQLGTGRIKVLGVTAPQRLPGAFAGIPTWSEQGLDVNVVNWRAAIGPSGLSSTHVAFWVDAFEKMSQSEAWKRELEKYYWGTTFLPPEKLRNYLDEEYTRLKTVLTELGLARQ